MKKRLLMDLQLARKIMYIYCDICTLAVIINCAQIPDILKNQDADGVEEGDIVLIEKKTAVDEQSSKRARLK